MQKIKEFIKKVYPVVRKQAISLAFAVLRHAFVLILAKILVSAIEAHLNGTIV